MARASGSGELLCEGEDKGDSDLLGLDQQPWDWPSFSLLQHHVLNSSPHQILHCVAKAAVRV